MMHLHLAKLWNGLVATDRYLAGDEFPFGARPPSRCYVGFGECKTISVSHLGKKSLLVVRA